MSNTAGQSLRPVPVQTEMDCTLVRLVHHFEFDFVRAAASFAEYGRFLATLHPKSHFFQSVDWRNDFNPDICRCRYALIQFRDGIKAEMANENEIGKEANEEKGEKEEEEKNDKELERSEPQQEMGDKDVSSAKIEDEKTPLSAARVEVEAGTAEDGVEEDRMEERPSGFNIFERSLKEEFEQLYEEVRSSLPSVPIDVEDSDEDDDDDDEEIEIFKSNLPPPTEFELKYFNEDYFAQFGIASSTSTTTTTLRASGATSTSTTAMTTTTTSSTSVSASSSSRTTIVSPRQRSVETPRRIFNVDLNTMSEDDSEDILDWRQESTEEYERMRAEEEQWEREYFAQVEASTDLDVMDVANEFYSEEPAQELTLSTTTTTTATSVSTTQSSYSSYDLSRMRRMQPYEHESDVEDSEEELELD